MPLDMTASLLHSIPESSLFHVKSEDPETEGAAAARLC